MAGPVPTLIETTRFSGSADHCKNDKDAPEGELSVCSRAGAGGEGVASFPTTGTEVLCLLFSGGCGRVRTGFDGGTRRSAEGAGGGGATI